MKSTIEIEYLVQATNPPKKKAPKTPIAVQGIRLGFQTVGRLAPYAAGKKAFELLTTPRSRAQHKTTDALLESAQRAVMKHGTHSIQTYTWGSGGKTILLVHGWQSRGTALRSFVPPLLEKGYKVVALDGPAHGDSSGQQLTVPLFGEVILNLWDQQEEVAGVITHSFGGPSTLYALGFLDQKQRILPKFGMVAAPSSFKAVIDNTAQFLYLPSKVQSTFVAQAERAVGRRVEELEYQHYPATARIQELLIFHDRFDTINPFTDALQLAEQFPQSKIVATEGLGHFRLVKHPKVIERMGAFFD